MTATPNFLPGVLPVSDHNPIPGFMARPLAANEQVGKSQFTTVDVATGYAILNDGTSADHIPLGVGDLAELSDKSSVSGNAWVRASMRHVVGHQQSAVSNDAFVEADFCKPFYIASENTIGKLSHTGADATVVNRPLGGLFINLGKDTAQMPVVWSSPYAWILARSLVRNDADVIARDSFALTANTTRAEAIIPRQHKCRCKAVSARIVALAAFTAHDTNYWTITISKRTATTPGTAVVVASKTTQITGGTGNLTAFKYADLDLSTTIADLTILETDVITVTCTAQTTAGAISQIVVELIAKPF